jgi:hypothetical protein
MIMDNVAAATKLSARTLQASPATPYGMGLWRPDPCSA